MARRRGGETARHHFRETDAVPVPLGEIADAKLVRWPTGMAEFDFVLGGGIVPGSLILIGGEPGIGKSTLLLQAAARLEASGRRTLYVSGEESEQQIKMRAERLEVQNSDCYILTETGTQNIFKQIEQLQPHMLVIDSIQTLHSSFIESGAGSVSPGRRGMLILLSTPADLLSEYSLGSMPGRRACGPVRGPRFTSKTNRVSRNSAASAGLGVHDGEPY